MEPFANLVGQIDVGRWMALQERTCEGQKGLSICMRARQNESRVANLHNHNKVNTSDYLIVYWCKERTTPETD